MYDWCTFSGRWPDDFRYRAVQWRRLLPSAIGKNGDNTFGHSGQYLPNDSLDMCGLVLKGLNVTGQIEYKELLEFDWRHLLFQLLKANFP